MEWGYQGGEEIDAALAKKQSEGGGGNYGPRTFYIKDPGTTRLIIVLDDEPFAYYAHNMYPFGGMGTEVCLDKHNLQDSHGNCPFCEYTKGQPKDSKNRSWASLQGCVTVIDCGEIKETAAGRVLVGYTSKKGQVYNFDRKLLTLKQGGADKPGTLPKWRRLKEKRKTLVGAVFEFTRTGAKEESIGTEWEYVGSVDVSSPAAIRKAIKELEGFQVSQSDLVDSQYADGKDFGPFQYRSVIKIKNRNELLTEYKVPGLSASSGGAYTDAINQGGTDEEVPF